MNTTQEAKARIIPGDLSEVGIGVDTLRHLADLTEMIGYEIVHTCPQGYGAKDVTLEDVSFKDVGRIRIRARRPNGDTYVASMCHKCRVSVVLDLGTVEA